MTDETQNPAASAPEAPQSFLPFDPRQLTALRMRPVQIAELFGVSKQCVSQWIKKGILTIGADGRIDPIRATDEVMRKTDPGRLRAKLFKQSGDAEAQLRARVTELEAQLAATDAPPPAEASDYHRHRSERERYAALAAKRDYEASIGALVRADDVASAAGAAVTLLRTRLEALPDMIAPCMVAVSEQQARALIAEQVEHALEELARQFAQIAKAPDSQPEDKCND